MRLFYESLSERERRRYVAVEALKTDHGGQSYFASVVGCCRDTVASGIAELATLSDRWEHPSVSPPRGLVFDRRNEIIVFVGDQTKASFPNV
jgi:hypothetical protein